MKRRIFIFWLLLFLVSGACYAGLSERIDSIIGADSQKGVEFSIKVLKAISGETLYSHQSQKELIPASNMKIITTAAALKFFGPEYEYETKVVICDDTVVVIGGGDPLLGDKVTDVKYGRPPGWIFEEIIQSLKEKGIRKVEDIIVDTTIFDDVRVHPSWSKSELNRWYACEVSGLNYNSNCIEIGAWNEGGKVAVSVKPDTNFVKIVNKVDLISSGKSVVGSYRTSEINKIIVFGKCGVSGRSFDVAIERPAAFFGYLLAEKLAEAGIETAGQLYEKAVPEDCNVDVLCEFSHTIEDCLARCNKDSYGLAAEALLKTIAAKQSGGGKNGSWKSGREIVSRYLLRLGLDETEFYIDDASGLSRNNRLSANAITRVILAVYKGENWEIYKESLAVGGKDGTIDKYFTDAKYRGKILGKTGYISGVKSFSGLCLTERGDYIFSAIANGANGRTRGTLNEIAKAIVDGE